MINLIPFFILFLASVAILYIQQKNVKLGYSWFLAVGAGIVTWAVILSFHWVSQPSFILEGKGLIQNTSIELAYQMDQFSFPYALALISLGIVIILTDLGRSQVSASSPWTWAGILAIMGTGFLAIISVSPFAIIFSWTIIDLIEILFITRSLSDNRMVMENILAFSARVTGTMVLVVATFYSRSLGQDLLLSDLTPAVGILLLIATGLRLGVIPLHLPYQEIGPRRGMGTIIRIIGPASSLVILSRLPVPVVMPVWGPWLSLFLCVTMLYTSLMWLTSSDEITGRPYWIITLSSFAMLCAIRSQTIASIGWGIGLILSGGVLFLYSSRKTQLLFLPLLGLIGISGLPFTPVVSSWRAIFVDGFDAVGVVFILSHGLILLGYLRHTFHEGIPFDSLDRWAQILLPLGLLILIANEWFLGVFGWPDSFIPGFWIGNTILFLLVLFLYVAYTRYKDRLPIFRQRKWLETGKKILGFITQVLSLRWLILAGLFIYQVIQRVVGRLILLLEGEGGILWALLLLVLVVSIANGGRFF